MMLDSNSPVRSLVLTFAAWKAFLLLIAVVSSLGSAYDTSTTLLSPDTVSFREAPFDLVTRLTRWDAIYFVQIARRGYLFEQDWAFGKGLPTVISLVVKGQQAHERASVSQLHDYPDSAC
jgi:GPI mannosyltransferase 2